MWVYAPPIGLLFLALGTKWQQELRECLGMPRLETYDLLRTGLLQGFLANQLLALADETASLADGRTRVGAIAPVTPLRSGSPVSLAPWQTLGMQGRDFIGTGPSVTELSAFAGRAATEPILLYAGLDSAGSAEERARLVVREMDRTGAFERGGGRGDHADRHRLGGRRRDRLAGVSIRRRHRAGVDAVLVPAELDLVPGGPVEGRRVVPGADRRRA